MGQAGEREADEGKEQSREKSLVFGREECRDEKIWSHTGSFVSLVPPFSYQALWILGTLIIFPVVYVIKTGDPVSPKLLFWVNSVSDEMHRRCADTYLLAICL